MSRTIKVKVDIAEKLAPLFQPKRYKIVHGGRGGAKSWGIARTLLVSGMQEKQRILCGREFQNSITESVHALLADQISVLGLNHFYKVQNTTIVGQNGTDFIFAGLRHNVDKIKSYEKIKKVWVEEAHNVSKNSWATLIPTIRMDGSEIWVSFNPELDTDETYQRFVVHPPEHSTVIQINWRDNPWFPEVLRQEMLELKKKDYDSYLTVWEGKCRQTLDGAIYAEQIRAAVLDGRINPQVLVDRARGLIIVFDLGRADMCSLWFIQQVGMEHHVVDYYENTGHGIDHYLEEIQKRKYIISGIWLPHDGAHETQAAGKLGSIERQVKRAGYEGRVNIIPRVAKATRINALRALFPRMMFNEATCSDGLQALRHYQFGVHPETGQRTKEPLHNWASHAADSIGGYAVMLREGVRKEKEVVQQQSQQYGHNQGWMN